MVKKINYTFVNNIAFIELIIVNMIERINKIIEANNMSTTQFADTINIQRPSMSHIIAGRNNPSLDFVTKVLKAFPNINPDWLIFGSGEMYRNDANNSERIENNTSKNEISNEYDLFSSAIETDTKNQSNLVVNETINVINDSEAQALYTKNVSPKIKNDSECDNQMVMINPEQKIDSNEVKVPAKSDLMPRTIIKVLFFYSDKTFSEFFPES